MTTRFDLELYLAGDAHAIGAALRWPELRAVVFEMATVCEVAREVIGSYRLQDRVTTQTGDLWNDPLPSGDLHFNGDIFHDWPDDKCRQLADKSFDALEPGGRIMIHEVLYNEDKTGPFVAAAYSVAMLLWSEGVQRSQREHADILVGAGQGGPWPDYPGYAKVYSGADGSILYTFYGDSAGDNFGISLERIAPKTRVY